ncbi:MAG: AbrB/MazE/SpoVT family DNA-binding domain-containing protein [Paenibacillus polymyxa]
MKNTGMTRPLDSLGRIVIPIEIRTNIGIEINEPLEFYIDVEKGFMSIGKYSDRTSCKLCNSIQDLGYFKSSLLCRKCILDLKGNVGVMPIPHPSDKEVHKEHKTRRSTLKLLKSLRELKRKHPGAKQSEYAKWLGVSQSRISQIAKLL